MKTYTFTVCFGGGPKCSDSASFDLELNDQEIEYIKSYLKKNGDCGYEHMEWDNPGLFSKLNGHANDAVLDAINEESDEPVEFDDVDWEYMEFDFLWPDELRPEEDR